ncbi:MAG: hypothetical protein ACOYJ1_13725 [Peptococcales bacterium]
MSRAAKPDGRGKAGLPGYIANGHWRVYPKTYEKVLKKSSIALLQNYYNFFTLDLDMLTGKNAGDIIILNSGG